MKWGTHSPRSDVPPLPKRVCIQSPHKQGQPKHENTDERQAVVAQAFSTSTQESEAGRVQGQLSLEFQDSQLYTETLSRSTGPTPKNKENTDTGNAVLIS